MIVNLQLRCSFVLHLFIFVMRCVDRLRAQVYYLWIYNNVKMEEYLYFTFYYKPHSPNHTSTYTRSSSQACFRLLLSIFVRKLATSLSVFILVCYALATLCPGGWVPVLCFIFRGKRICPSTFSTSLCIASHPV